MAFVPSAGDKYHQGYYKLQNVHKYLGNPVDIVYRSSWELKFMIYCDLNPGVRKWASEMIRIPYVDSGGHSHVYIPDFYLETDNAEEPLMPRKFVVEIKPEAETRQPLIPNSISEKQLKNLEYQLAQWQKNKYKWAYASEWCKGRDIKFWLVTEVHLNRLKP